MRGRGLGVGIELDRPAKPYCEALLQEGVLPRETHENVLHGATAVHHPRRTGVGLARIEQVFTQLQ